MAKPELEARGFNFGRGMSEPGFESVLSLRLVLQAIITLTILFILVDGALPQLEMAVFGGSLLISPAFNNIALYLSLAFVMISRERTVYNIMAVPALFLLCYVFADAVYLYFVESLGLLEILKNDTNYYGILTIAALCASYRFKVSEKLVLALLMLFFVLNILFASMQFFTNSPVLPTESNDHKFVVFSSIILGSQRAFGLCANGLALGFFFTLTGSLGMSYCRKMKTFVLGFLLLSLSAFGCYITRVRLTYLTFVCSVISVLILSRKSWRKVGKFLPLVWFVVALGVMVYSLTYGVSDVSLTNNESMATRYAGWVSSIEEYSASSTSEKIFGMGLLPSKGDKVFAGNDETRVSSYPIDNNAILLLVYAGAVGLMFVAFLWLYAWLYVYKRAVNSGSNLHMMVAAFWSTILLSGSFNFTFTHLAVLLLISVLCDPGAETPDAVTPGVGEIAQ